MLAPGPRTDPPVNRGSREGVRDYLILAGIALVAILVVVAVPLLFAPARSSVASGSPPPSELLLAVGLSVSLCTAGAIYILLRRRWRFPSLAVGLAIAYNILIVLVKFTLGPVAMWKGEYDALFFGVAGVALSRGIAIFMVYSSVFVVVGGGFWFYAVRRLRSGGRPGAHWFGRRVPLVLIFGGIMIFAGSLMFVAQVLSPALSGDRYLQILFSGATATMVAVLVAGAITSGILSFYVTADRAVAIRDAGLVATLFWTGLALIALYHVLWVLYVIGLAAIWPLRTYVPK